MFGQVVWAAGVGAVCPGATGEGGQMNCQMWTLPPPPCVAWAPLSFCLMGDPVLPSQNGCEATERVTGCFGSTEAQDLQEH